MRDFSRSGFASRNFNKKATEDKEGRRVIRNTVLAILVGVFLCFAAFSVFAQNTFPSEVPVQTKALFCKDLESAKQIADNKGEVADELQLTGRCIVMSGVAVYVKEVYRNGDWAVWELTSRNIKTFYEATDWRAIPPKKKGVDT